MSPKILELPRREELTARPSAFPLGLFPPPFCVFFVSCWRINFDMTGMYVQLKYDVCCVRRGAMDVLPL